MKFLITLACVTPSPISQERNFAVLTDFQNSVTGEYYNLFGEKIITKSIGHFSPHLNHVTALYGS